jgi:hypothetical protein
VPRSYGTTNVAPYASAPTVGAVGDEYYNTASKVLYLSDGTAWNPVSGAAGSGAAYAEVQATPPPAASPPAIVPPLGLLWVDTSTTASWAAAPFYPTQTPPPTGFNSYTDGAGMVWVSLNGSAWKMARDVLHARWYRNAALTLTSTFIACPYDTVDRDPYGLWVPASTSFQVPIAGLYRFTLQLTATTTATGQYVSGNVYKTGGVQISGMVGSPSLATWAVGASNDLVMLVAGDYIQFNVNSSVSMSVVTGRAMTFGTISYVGTG